MALPPVVVANDLQPVLWQGPMANANHAPHIHGHTLAPGPTAPNAPPIIAANGVPMVVDPAAYFAAYPLPAAFAATPGAAVAGALPNQPNAAIPPNAANPLNPANPPNAIALPLDGPRVCGWAGCTVVLPRAKPSDIKRHLLEAHFGDGAGQTPWNVRHVGPCEYTQGGGRCGRVMQCGNLPRHLAVAHLHTVPL
ncbi:hypothetical protein B0H21DRAFT_768012 [Amylocystis lapponica]|nr:hypothetical protein B0H21DRAFT_768012 [Amylocystis lapponica]